MTINDKRKEYPLPPIPATLQEMEAMLESVRAQVESVRTQMESIEEVQAKLEFMIDTKKIQQEKSEGSMEAFTFAETMSNEDCNCNSNSDAEADPVTSNNHSDENDTSTGQTRENASDGTISSTTSTTTSCTTTALELSDEEVKRMLFVGSTHRLLFLDTIPDPSGHGPDYKVGCWDRYIAISIIVFQYLAYAILALSVMGDTLENGYFSDWRPIEIQAKYCPDPNYANYDTLSEAVVLNSSNLLASLKCEQPRELDPIFWGESTVVVLVLAFFMLNAFLLPDLFEGFVLFKCRGWAGKMTSMLVYFELCLAFFAGNTAWLIGYYQGAFGFLETILFVVGIVFVHDLDEKFEHWRGILRQVQQRHRCLEFQFWTLFLVTFFIFGYCSLFSILELYNWLKERA